jgi:amino acid permease
MADPRLTRSLDDSALDVAFLHSDLANVITASTDDDGALFDELYNGAVDIAALDAVTNSSSSSQLNKSYDSPSWREMLKPGTSRTRLQGSVKSSTFMLVSTIMGGGVLSIPYAIAQAGVVIGPIIITLLALLNCYTLGLVMDLGHICAAAKLPATFPTVAKLAYGRVGELGFATMVFILTFFSVIAYIILLGDLARPVAQLLCAQHSWCKWLENRNAICAFFVGVISFPLAAQKTLHSLRFTSFLSVASIVLLVTLIFVAYLKNPHPLVDYDDAGGAAGTQPLPVPPEDIVYANWNTSMLLTVSIGTVSFLCHFNAVSVYATLRKPTVRRVRTIISCSIFLPTVLYVFTGVFGYLPWRAVVDGDVLKMYSNVDELIGVGRAALCVTLILNLPLLMQPCRETLNMLLLKADSPLKESATFRIVESFLLFAACLGVTIKVKQVAVVFSFMGATLGILIAVILPCAFFLRIRRLQTGLVADDAKLPSGFKVKTHEKLAPWLIAIGIVLILASTGESINHAIDAGARKHHLDASPPNGHHHGHTFY